MAVEAAAQRMVFAVVERLAGRDDDRLAGVDAQRVHVLHVADGDAVVVAVAHHLVFDLFIVVQVLLDQDLGREGQRACDDLSQLLAVMRDARSLTAQRETGAHHHGKADFLADAAAPLRAFPRCGSAAWVCRWRAGVARRPAGPRSA